MNNKSVISIIYAFMAAVFYAVSTPFSKLLLEYVSPTFLASFLYLGAGVGVGIMYIFRRKNEKAEDKLSKKDLPYTVGMIVLDIAAPIFLMFGIKFGNASNASLLGNFEIVATTLIALVIFNEKVSKKLWTAIMLITTSSIILSFDGTDGFDFSYGSLFVVLATVCWGLENNCTRKISEKSTYEIVVLKGIFSGLGSCIVALFMGETLPNIKYIFLAMLLGFFAYGLSIFAYIKAQRHLGATKTSAYYAVAPFIGAAISFILIGNKFTFSYLIALIIMLLGTFFVVTDTLANECCHTHTHILTHTHDGCTHSHIIEHKHNGDFIKHSKKSMRCYEKSVEHLKAHQKM